MRIRVVFKPELGLGSYSKVLLPIPTTIELIRDLIAYMRETFGLPEQQIGAIFLTIDDFVLPDSQRVSDVLTNDDVVLVQTSFVAAGEYLDNRENHDEGHSAKLPRIDTGSDGTSENGDEGPPAKLPRIEAESAIPDERTDLNKHEELGITADSDEVADLSSISAEPTDSLTKITLAEGDMIQFIDRSTEHRMEGVVREVIEDGMCGNPIIKFTHVNGPIDSLPLSDMKDLEVVPLQREEHDDEASPVLKIHPSPPLPPLPAIEEVNPDHLKRADHWKARQRKKSTAALRRQVEWFVKQESSVEVDDILRRPRIKDLCESFEELSEAIKESKVVKFSEKITDSGDTESRTMIIILVEEN
jgi:hypothetical protein